MWGVSVEDRRYGLPRIDALRASPAKIKWLSIEPLLEDLGVINLDGINWVVVGGESGAKSRPMKEEWVLSIRDQCQAAGVKFFFKQWGNWRPSGSRTSGKRVHRWPDGTTSVRLSKKDAGRRLRGRIHNASPRIQTQNCPDPKTRREFRKLVGAIIDRTKLREVCQIFTLTAQEVGRQH
jgi:protein gp37